MELRHLRYFEAVAECENFRRAAARLHVAQPALSRQIHALERMLGVELFERQPRGTRLSPAGQAFLDDVRHILADVERAKERACRVAEGKIGTIRVGFNEIAARQSYLPGFFHSARCQFPEIDIRLDSCCRRSYSSRRWVPAELTRAFCFIARSRMMSYKLSGSMMTITLSPCRVAILWRADRSFIWPISRTSLSS